MLARLRCRDEHLVPAEVDVDDGARVGSRRRLQALLCGYDHVGRVGASGEERWRVASVSGRFPSCDYTSNPLCITLWPFKPSTSSMRSFKSDIRAQDDMTIALAAAAATFVTGTLIYLLVTPAGAFINQYGMVGVLALTLAVFLAALLQ